MTKQNSYGLEVKTTPKKKKIKCDVMSKLHWGDTQFTLLGLEFSINLSNILQINYSKTILKTKHVINSWRFRYLTPVGKKIVLKTLILSQFNHLFTSVVIGQNILIDINKIFFMNTFGMVNQIK